MLSYKKYSLLVAAMFVFACGRVDVAFFNLGTFRVMAVQVDMPELDSEISNTVSITPWISDVEAAGRNITLNTVACLDPGITLGEVPTCEPGDLGYQVLSEISFDTSSLNAQYFSGAMPSFNLTVPAGLLDLLSSAQKMNGLNYIVSMTFKAGDEETKAVKRILLSTNPDKNLNPQLQSIEVDGALDKDIADQSKLSFTVMSGAEPQTYTRINGDGETVTAEEEYLVTWFVHGGVLSLSRTDIGQDNVFSLKEDVTGEPFVFAVLRDSRGGVDISFRD